jgi:hypothetical protein
MGNNNYYAILNLKATLRIIRFKEGDSMDSLRLTARIIGVVCFFFGLANAALAQRMIAVKAGAIQYLYGSVFLDGKAIRIPRDGYIQMENGQFLNTDLGRVELALGPSAILRLDENSSLAMEQSRMKDARLELMRGIALIEVLAKIDNDPITFRMSSIAIKIRKPGLYRLNFDRCEVRVYGGELSAFTGNKETVAKKGTRICMDDHFVPKEFDIRRVDALYIWSGFRSFSLFVANPNNKGMPNWKVTAKGDLKNSNYRLSFRTNADWVKNWWQQEE